MVKGCPNGQSFINVSFFMRYTPGYPPNSPSPLPYRKVEATPLSEQNTDQAGAVKPEACGGCAKQALLRRPDPLHKACGVTGAPFPETPWWRNVSHSDFRHQNGPDLVAEFSKLSFSPTRQGCRFGD